MESLEKQYEKETGYDYGDDKWHLITWLENRIANCSNCSYLMHEQEERDKAIVERLDWIKVGLVANTVKGSVTVDRVLKETQDLIQDIQNNTIIPEYSKKD